jgi:hypothetical protein
MKRKNLFFVSALILFGLANVNSVKAQFGKSVDVTANIILHPIQAIVVNPTTINLTYLSLDDYNNGVKSENANHLTVYAVGGFVVRVKAGDVNFVNGTKNIPVSDVIVKATASGTSPGAFSDVPLSTTATPLITSTSTGGFALKYNVVYDNTAAGDVFGYAGKDEGTYTATVTYSIDPS